VTGPKERPAWHLLLGEPWRAAESRLLRRTPRVESATPAQGTGWAGVILGMGRGYSYTKSGSTIK